MKTKRLQLITKNPWIVERVDGASVLHVGCTDWPLTEDRISTNNLLHAQLCESSSRCIGVDLDQKGIDKLREWMPEHEFYCLNAESLDKEPSLADTQWDFIVAGDVVEHMDNPGMFFKAAHRLLKKDGTLIVTVPSAFSAKRFFWLLFLGHEQVHPDHTGYFSEATLRRIGARSGFEIAKIHGFQWHNPTVKNRVANAISAPIVWFSGGRCSDELAVEFRKSDSVI
jgi:2-polyprenyl-3-methyl-5-hydroxy-6-metoxy-1,4-benzoquinol methylase